MLGKIVAVCDGVNKIVHSERDLKPEDRTLTLMADYNLSENLASVLDWNYLARDFAKLHDINVFSSLLRFDLEDFLDQVG